ncbi:MAG TPA: hypothetical protein VF766_13160 [Pyrinomonadaceae bacterium]
MQRSNTKLKVCFVVMFTITLANLGESFYGQGQQDLSRDKVDKETQRLERKKELEGRFPIADYEAPEPSHPQERAKRKARGERHNKSTLGVKGGLNAPPNSGTETILTNDWEVSVPRIPVAQSDVVLVGTILDANAYISTDRNGVYSEFTLKVEDVFKRDKATLLSVGESVLVERQGGRVRFPSGRVEWYRIALQSMPQVNCRYVLFLKRLDDDSFSIITGYELREGKVHPLDNDASQFRIYEGVDEVHFLHQVREAIAAQ